MSEQENKELVRRLIEEAYNTKDLAVVDEVISPDYVGHMTGFDRRGREALREHFVYDHTGWPDARCTIDDTVAEGDLVACRLLWSGTLTGPTNLGPPSGKYSEAALSLFSRIVRGQIVEQWWLWDNLGWMLQMGGAAMVLQAAERRERTAAAAS